MAKDADGNAVGIELEELPAESKDAFSELVEELEALISDEDVEDLAEALEPNSSAAILLFEHTWAIPFRDAIANSGGQLVVAPAHHRGSTRRDRSRGLTARRPIDQPPNRRHQHAVAKRTRTRPHRGSHRRDRRAPPARWAAE